MVEPEHLRATAPRVDLQRMRTVSETAACTKFDAIIHACRVLDCDAYSINETLPGRVRG
jgi:dTDP-4-dehydrorhamnose reductase